MSTVDIVVPQTATNPGMVVHDGDKQSHHHPHHPWHDPAIDALGRQILANQVHAVDSTVERLGLAGIQATDRAGLDNINATDRMGLSNIQATDLNGRENQVETVRSYGHIAKQVEETTGEVKEVVNTNAFRIENLMVREVNLLNVQAERNVAATNLAIEKIAAASQLTAFQNTAQILAAQAECCCEIKELIRADGEKTRDLANQIQKENQAMLLVDAKNEILALKLRATATVSI